MTWRRLSEWLYIFTCALSVYPTPNTQFSVTKFRLEMPMLYMCVSQISLSRESSVEQNSSVLFLRDSTVATWAVLSCVPNVFFLLPDWIYRNVDTSNCAPHHLRTVFFFFPSVSASHFSVHSQRSRFFSCPSKILVATSGISPITSLL